MKSYRGALAMLGKRDKRKLENNTYLIRRDNYIAVKLHNTEVIKYYPNGDIQLNTGGWETVTTKDRLNKYGPINIWQRNFTWFYGDYNNPEKFVDGDYY